MINYSIIIPHKNTLELLRRCLASIPRRDDVEIIIVDNNSDKQNAEFGDDIRNDKKNIIIVHDDTSIGGGGARNTGLKMAKGEWVLFADADDYYSDGFLDVLDYYITQDIDVLYFGFKMIKKGNEIDFPYSLKFLKKFQTDEKYIESLKYRVHAPWNKMIKRQFLLEHNCFFEDRPRGNDTLFSLRVAYASRKVMAEPSSLYMYTIHDNSVSHKKLPSKSAYYDLFQQNCQVNEVLKYVGHSEWTRLALSRMLSTFLSRDIYAFFRSFSVYVCDYMKLRKNRFYYVDVIKNKDVKDETQE